MSYDPITYEEMQDALPPHKRDGYAERLADLADQLRDQERDNGR